MLRPPPEPRGALKRWYHVRMNDADATIVGWDIGGVNTKAAALLRRGSRVEEVRTAGRYVEVWRHPERLPDTLRAVMDDLALPDAPAPLLAITMTAELSDVYRSKADGVTAVFSAVETAFPHATIFALRLDERFVRLEEARRAPRDFAAANWLAAALYLARACPDCLWIDIGSTTTDIIPIVGGAVRAQGRTDTARLAGGELVYTGALRTPLGAVAAMVPVRGTLCRTAPEFFATTADVHLALGHLTPASYTCPTADGRARTVEASLERISRIVCADGDSLSAAEALALARSFAEAQLEAIGAALLQVTSRFADIPPLPILATGDGAFLGRAVARRLGHDLLPLPPSLPPAAAAILPCYAAASLLAASLGT
ncbi:MAG: hydantoinase/oxoprolinase family protein [Chloroflexota bacterium]